MHHNSTTCFKKLIWNGYFSLSSMEIFVGTSVGAPILLEQFQNSTRFNTERESTCPFLSHIGNSIPKSSYMCLYLIVWKKIFIVFCIKFNIYMYIKYVTNNNYKNVFFFNFSFSQNLTAKLNGNGYYSICYYNILSILSKTWVLTKWGCDE